jgi:hypothetical protein
LIKAVEIVTGTGNPVEWFESIHDTPEEGRATLNLKQAVQQMANVNPQEIMASMGIGQG